MNSSDRFDSLIQFYAEKHDIPFDLLKAVIRQESGFDPHAISRVGARGLMQMMPKTWKEWQDGTPGIQSGPQLDPNSPENSIRAGTSYLDWLIDKFHDIRKSLAAYNWGPRNLGKIEHDSNWLDRVPKETHDYVERICNGIKQICDGK